MEGEFWLGLDKIHRITSGRLCSLQVNLVAFDGSQAYANYKMFAVNDESDKYRLNVAGYSGTAGDSLTYHNLMSFGTKDRDNDRNPYNCAHRSGGAGGWWYNYCFTSALNGKWGRSTGYKRNIVWGPWKGNKEALKETTMKIKCQ
uniref:Ficolin-1-like n=1 Tax=Phallusia mammillata TaxID=59560 RepID=A0A6F9DDD6_9ASCI|nr:ficolin-1-like [Phallusia mammillata]